jgi:hypothetical protein
MGCLFPLNVRTYVTALLLFLASRSVVCFQQCQWYADLPLSYMSDSSLSFLQDPFSLETEIYVALLRVFTPIQSFVLGPRLILGLREYHAMLVADSDVATGMSSIVFQECVHVSTSSNL